MPAFQTESRLLDDQFLSSLETLELYLHSPLGSRFAGIRPSRSYGGASDFADYREYMPGDDLRRIDWNLAARTDQYFIKQFMDERKMNVHIYIDTSASMNGDFDGSKSLAALRLAGAVGYLAVRTMDSVSFRILTGSSCRFLGNTVNGRASLFQAFRQLGEIRFSGECDLCAALLSDPACGYDDGLSVIISDFLSDSNWKSAVDNLLMRKREVALIRLLSPGEERPAYRGMHSLLDAELSQAEALRLDIDREALKSYTEALEWFDSDMAAFCASRSITLLTARSDEPPQDVLIRKGFAAGFIRQG